MIRVFGLDTSLSTTGIAAFDETNEEPYLTFAATPPGDGTLEGDIDRIVLMASEVYRRVTNRAVAGDDVWIVFEGPSMHSLNGKPDERAGLRWHLAIAFRRLGYRIIFAPPGSVKKYWTHNGNAPKPLMMAWARRRYPTAFIRDHNVADALALAHMGARVRGLLPSPLPPEVHAPSLDGIPWPQPKQEAP